MNWNGLLRHRLAGRALVLLGALSLLSLAPRSELSIALAVLAGILVLLPDAATSRSVHGLYGIFLWSMLAMQAHDRFNTAGQVAGFLLLYAAATLFVYWMTSVHELHSWIMAQAVGITLAETFLILLFWPVNFPSQALMITAMGFLGLEIIEHAQRHTLSPRQLILPFAVVAVSIAGTSFTARWMEY